MFNRFMVLAWLTAGVCLMNSAGVLATDWPRWRGVAVDGVSAERGWLEQWPADGPKQLWKSDVGVGYSSMSVSSGHLYTMGNTNDIDIIYCLDANTGATVWTHSYPCIAKDPNGYPGTRCTPTVDGNHVYAGSRRGNFFCLDANNGNVIWSKDFPKDYGAKIPMWGFAGSPLVEGDSVICEVGGAGSSVVAFNKNTGDEIWKAGDDPIGYSSIVPFTDRGQRCLAVLSGRAIVGRSIKDGKELWRMDWKTSYDINAATPIIVDNKVFVSSGYGTGCALIEFGADGAKVVWQNKNMRNHVATCIFWEGYLYGFDESEFKCLDFKTGEVKWSEKSYGKGSVFLANGKLIVYGQKGKLGVVQASPDGFKEITSFQALGGNDTWAVPVLANGKVYCRSLRDLVCLDVAAN